MLEKTDYQKTSETKEANSGSDNKDISEREKVNTVTTRLSKCHCKQRLCKVFGASVKGKLLFSSVELVKLTHEP